MKAKSFLSENWMLALIIVFFVISLARAPIRTGQGFVIGMRGLADVILIILTVFLFVGLFTVWIKEDFVIKHFGEDTGVRGLFYGALLGTIFHGPIASVFPLLRSFLEKGARLAVVVTVISAYAIKLPFIPLELRLFGLRFTILHNLLILMFSPLIGLIMERVLGTVELRDAPD